VRFGPSRENEFSYSKQWGPEDELKLLLFERIKSKPDGTCFQGKSFSGGERNRLFMRSGDNYKEWSLVSGMDFREDGRGFVLFDYNNDGWIDVGVVSPNSPRFRIMKNRFADTSVGKGKPNSVSIELIGGHDSSEQTTEWSPRDAFGTTLLVTTGGQKRMFQLSGGEGLSSQNSSRVHIGLGESESIDRIEIKWPSGKTTVKEKIGAGERVTILERED